MKTASVDEISDFVQEIFDSLIKFEFNLDKLNENFPIWKEKYKEEDICYWAALLRTTSSFKDKLSNWNQLLEDSKQRILTESNEENMKDILYGLI